MKLKTTNDDTIECLRKHQIRHSQQIIFLLVLCCVTLVATMGMGYHLLIEDSATIKLERLPEFLVIVFIAHLVWLCSNFQQRRLKAGRKTVSDKLKSLGERGPYY